MEATNPGAPFGTVSLHSAIASWWSPGVALVPSAVETGQNVPLNFLTDDQSCRPEMDDPNMPPSRRGSSVARWGCRSGALREVNRTPAASR